MRSDKAVRRAILRRSHYHFFHYYFHDYIEHQTAPFQKELFDLTQNFHGSTLVVSAFRNSGKSTILSLSYVLWSIIGNPKAKFILLASETQQKAQTLLGHVKQALEDNPLLKEDFGPFMEDHSIWNAQSVIIKNYGAKIMAVSTEQSVRGYRHLSHRPDLIIIDDAENQESVRTKEARDKLDRWLSSDVIPAGHGNTKLIVIGSMLHQDGLIKRLQKRIDDLKMSGTYRIYPILDSNGKPMWPGKHSDLAAIEKEKARGIPDREWRVEFMCEIVAEENQVIKEEWIQYYDSAPRLGTPECRYAATGVDLAISQKESADFTTMVSGIVGKTSDGWKLYIMPHPINERMEGPQIVERIYQQSKTLGNGNLTDMYIENVAFQQSMVDFVRQRGIHVEGVSPGGSDKRARLISVSEFIKSGKVVFPKRGTEHLFTQLVGFGSEGHDDLVDALVILILKIVERENHPAYTIPSSKPYQIPSQAEGEKEADQELVLWQEGMSTGNFTRYIEFTRQKNKKYWDKEALGGLKIMMRR